MVHLSNFGQTCANTPCIFRTKPSEALALRSVLCIDLSPWVTVGIATRSNRNTTHGQVTLHFGLNIPVSFLYQMSPLQLSDDGNPDNLSITSMFVDSTLKDQGIAYFAEFSNIFLRLSNLLRRRKHSSLQ